MKTSVTALMLALMTLTGCSESPSLHYYQLAQVPAVNAPNAADAPVLVVENVMVADFLDSNALVLQRSDVELVRAQQNLWVEPLGSQLSRNLRASIQQQLPAVRIASQAPASPHARLLVQVEQFHGSEAGQVLIKVRYSLMHNGQIQQFDYQWQQAQPQDGYASLVQSLSTGWQAAATEISQRIQPLL